MVLIWLKFRMHEIFENISKCFEIQKRVFKKKKKPVGNYNELFEEKNIKYEQIFNFNAQLDTILLRT